MLSGITLRIKIILFTAAIFVSLLVVAVFGLQALRHASESDNIARINQLMKSTVNIVEQFEHYVATGELDEAQAKKLATEMLRENKYHDSEYVYVVERETRLYCHSSRPSNYKVPVLTTLKMPVAKA